MMRNNWKKRTLSIGIVLIILSISIIPKNVYAIGATATIPIEWAIYMGSSVSIAEQLYNSLTGEKQRQIEKVLGSAEYQEIVLNGYQPSTILRDIYDANEFKIERGKEIIANIAEYGEETKAWFRYLVENINIIDNVIVPCSEWILNNIYQKGKTATIEYDKEGYIYSKSAKYNEFTISEAQAKKYVDKIRELGNQPRYAYLKDSWIYLGSMGKVYAIADINYKYPIIGVTGEYPYFVAQINPIDAHTGSAISFELYGDTLEMGYSQSFKSTISGLTDTNKHNTLNAKFYEMSLSYNGYIEYKDGALINKILDAPPTTGIEQAYEGTQSDIIWNVNGTGAYEGVSTKTDVIVLDDVAYVDSASDLATAIATDIAGAITADRAKVAELEGVNTDNTILNPNEVPLISEGMQAIENHQGFIPWLLSCMNIEYMAIIWAFIAFMLVLAIIGKVVG